MPYSFGGGSASGVSIEEAARYINRSERQAGHRAAAIGTQTALPAAAVPMPRVDGPRPLLTCKYLSKLCDGHNEIAAIVSGFHRWVPVVFTVFVVLAFAPNLWPEHPEWIYYLPLAPLALMLVSELYLFAMPSVSKNRA